MRPVCFKLFKIFEALSKEYVYICCLRIGNKYIFYLSEAKPDVFFCWYEEQTHISYVCSGSLTAK